LLKEKYLHKLNNMSGVALCIFSSTVPYTYIPLLDTISNTGIKFSDNSICSNAITEIMSQSEAKHPGVLINISTTIPDKLTKSDSIFSLHPENKDIISSNSYGGVSGINYKVEENIRNLLPSMYDTLSLTAFSTIISGGSGEEKIIEQNDFHKQLEAKKIELEKSMKNNKIYNVVTNKLDMFNEGLTRVNYLLNGFVIKTQNSSTSTKVAKIVSNAWLKMWELIHLDKLINTSDKTFTSFHNAEFPGSFIFAVNHYVKTYAPDMDHKWYASSLVDNQNTEQNNSALVDEYGMAKIHGQNWIMDKNNNGDVTNVKSLLHMNEIIMEKTNNEGVNLYTSDISSGQMVDQEDKEAILNAGQIVAGIMTLKKGGNMVTKQFTFFHKYTLSLMGILTKCFKIVKVVKPITSRPANSEVYLVCLDYYGKDSCKDIITMILNSIEKKDTTTPLCNLPNATMLSLNEASILHFNRNMKYLDRNIKCVEFLASTHAEWRQSLLSIIDDVGRKILDEWFHNYPIKFVQSTLILELHKNDQKFFEAVEKLELTIPSDEELLCEKAQHNHLLYNNNFPKIDLYAYDKLLSTDTVSRDLTIAQSFSEISSILLEELEKSSSQIIIDADAGAGMMALHLALNNDKIKIMSCSENGADFFALRNNIQCSRCYNVYPINKNFMKIMNDISPKDIGIIYLSPYFSQITLSTDTSTTVPNEAFQFFIDDIELLSVVKEIKLKGFKKIAVKVPSNYVDIDKYASKHVIDKFTVLVMY